MKRIYQYLSGVLILGMLVVGCIQTKGSISGTVTAASGGAPIANADILAVSMLVYLDLQLSSAPTISEIQAAITAAGKQAYSAKTTSAGTYAFPSVDVMEYAVAASAGGNSTAKSASLTSGVIGCTPPGVTVDFQL